MKFAIVMGRGIAGCGETKFSIEQHKWFVANGHESTIYASKDKSWSRKKSHDISEIIQLKFSQTSDIDIMINGCNSADVVIVNTLPSVSHPENAITGFNRFLSEVKKPVVLIQHDHAKLSIIRNACIDETIDKACIIFGHSSTNDFANMVYEKTGGELSSFFGDETKTIFNFQPGMDFDDVRAKYWKPIQETDPSINRWIGRTTSWKGYVQMFKFHNEYLRKNGFITIFEGIEKSPSFLDFKNISEMNYSDKYKGEFEVNQPAYVFGPYINDIMLERMSLSGFGYQLSTMKERFIERSIEYTHCEVACTGVVPVFRKSYGDRCTHRKYGDKLSSCKNTGTIWLDDNDMSPAYEELVKLSKDPVMRNEYREMAFEFYKEHQDSDHTFSEMMQTIKNNL